MKKTALLLTLLMLTTSIALASKYPKYDAELSKVRQVKNAQTSVINKEIKEVAAEMEALETNTTMSQEEKIKKRTEYSEKLNNLTTRKVKIQKQYDADKAQLKRLYKHK